MNNFKKIGLSALAGSLVAFSANAADFTISGGASLTMSDQGEAQEGNRFTMGDSLTFSASGETDGGLTITAEYEIDAGDLDDYSMSFGNDTMGTINFGGHGNSSALGAVDDVMPNAYEESWHGVSGALVINGFSSDNQFTYTSPTVGGITLSASYLPSSEAKSAKSTTAYAVTYSPEMVEGLTLGYATQDDNSGSATTTSDDTSESTMYAKYTYGSLTVGYQSSELDSDTNTEDADSTAFGVSYAVSDSLSIAYGQHTYETTGNTNAATGADQESSAVSASYTMGGMTIAGVMNDVDNVAGVAATDKEAYELNLSFAF